MIVKKIIKTDKSFIVASFLLLICPINVFSQKQQNTNFPNLSNYEKERFHFGFGFGFNTMNFDIENRTITNDTIRYLEPKAKPGFNVAFTASLKLINNLTIRLVPSYLFGERHIIYNLNGNTLNSTKVQVIEANVISIPLHLRYTSDRYNNFAMFMFSGYNFSMDLSTKRNVDNDVIVDKQIVKTDRDYHFIELGAGMDFYLEFFKFSIVLKLSKGLNNVLIQDENLWSGSIEALRPRMFVISFNFEN